jgi:hypothetical protein
MNWYCNIYLRERDYGRKLMLLIYNDVELDEIIHIVAKMLNSEVDRNNISIKQLGLALDMSNIIKGIPKYSKKKKNIKDIYAKSRYLIDIDDHKLYHTLISESYKIEIENFEQLMFKPNIDDNKEIKHDELTIENKLLALTLFDKCIEYKLNKNNK